jgi:hypothetical protein
MKIQQFLVILAAVLVVAVAILAAVFLYILSCR